MAEVTGVNLHRATVEMDGRQLRYDYLVVATGTRYDYFGHDDWPRFALSLKSVADAALVRHRILHAFEQAELETEPALVGALLTFVLVGAGPTGVEMAGALAELARFTLRREYRHIDTRNTRIVLLEAGARILAGFPDLLADKARRELERKGVQVRTDCAVTAVDEEGVMVNAQTRIHSRNVIWTAGVRGTPLGRSLGVETDRLGRVKVLPDLSIPGHPEVFVVGDLMVLEQDGKAFSPGLAAVAVQQGAYVGKLIARRATGRQNPGLFRYRDKGRLATVGRAFAIADFSSLRFAGFLAWMLWWTVHIMYLASLWNRLQVLMTWVWAYLTYQRSVRILTPESLSLQDVASFSDAAQPEPSGDPNSPLEPDTQQKGEALGSTKR